MFRGRASDLATRSPEAMPSLEHGRTTTGQEPLVLPDTQRVVFLQQTERQDVVATRRVTRVKYDDGFAPSSHRRQTEDVYCGNPTEHD